MAPPPLFESENGLLLLAEVLEASGRILERGFCSNAEVEIVSRGRKMTTCLCVCVCVCKQDVVVVVCWGYTRT